jgi:protein-disulfide isomerase
MSKRAGSKAAKAKQQQQQRILLIVGGAVAAVVIVAAIVLLTSPAGAELPDGVETKYEGLQQTQTAEGYPMLGDPDAPILVQDFSSYTCPACKTWHETIDEDVIPFVADGDVRFVAVPFDRQGEDETAMVRASLCAMEQDMYFEMSAVLYHWQGLVGYSNDRAESAADELGMDVDEFTDCINSNRANGLIAQARQDFVDRGFTGTPTVLVNRDEVAPSRVVAEIESLLTALEAQDEADNIEAEDN